MALSDKLLENISIVLVYPKYSENIGSAARVALNMGVSSLLVVCDHKPDFKRMSACATHNAKEIIADIKYYESLPGALAGFSMVMGTTARHGRGRQPAVEPHEIGKHLAPVLKKNKVAILFGPESRGLSNKELQACNVLTSIPTADFSSLNLAQAVAIICYELYIGLLKESVAFKNNHFSPRLATIEEQESMHLELALLVEQADRVAGKERPKSRLRKLRSFMGRMQLQAKETRLVSEMCRQLYQALKAKC